MCNDYIVKPFSINELGARVSAHLRRENRSKIKSRVLFDEQLAIDYLERAVYWDGNEIPLLKKEFDILEVLSQNPGQVFVLQAVISDNGGIIFANWHNSATFAKTGSQAEYLPFEGNETKMVRLWSLYPLSKLSSTTTQFEAFATYLMLMLFIAIVAFVSAVMVIGLKLVSTIWDDAEVYNNLRRLGMKREKIKRIITKQMLFVYFIPTVLG